MEIDDEKEFQWISAHIIEWKPSGLWHEMACSSSAPNICLRSHKALCRDFMISARCLEGEESTESVHSFVVVQYKPQHTDNVDDNDENKRVQFVRCVCVCACALCIYIQEERNVMGKKGRRRGLYSALGDAVIFFAPIVEPVRARLEGQ
uniref:Uncharacterized protein n=1 Tax=Caenorhabditis japonica TaxID=281687 RepID=A0A8R1EQT1_CAEJA